MEEHLLREYEENYGDSICFCIGTIANGYVKLNQEVIGTEHNFYLSEDIRINEKMFLAYRKISVLKSVDKVVDSDIYIGGEEREKGYNISYEEYKQLIKLFPNSTELGKYMYKRVEALIKDFFPTTDKYERIYENYITKKEKLHIQNVVNCYEDISKKIKLEQFGIAYDELRNLLSIKEVVSENIWQHKIYGILQLLYPQYIVCEREMSFKGVDGYDKRPDFVLVDANGFVDIMEIKKPTTLVLSRKPSYRNNYVPSGDLSGTIQQIEKYIYCLTILSKENQTIFDRLSNILPEKVTPQVVNPRGILLIGMSSDFNEQQTRDFEIIKRQYKNIVDIMTYDDLLSRIERIIFVLKNDCQN